MQIKTTMRYHLSEKLSSINQLTTSAGEDVEIGEHFGIVGNADWCTTVESSMGIPHEIKNGSAF